MKWYFAFFLDKFSKINSANINKSIPVWGENSLETTLRLNGLNVIHGGDNALRFTPYFKINEEEIDLVKQILLRSIKEYKFKFLFKNMYRN